MAGSLEVSEAATVYAALILADAEQEAEKLSAIIAAAGVEVDAGYPKVFAKALAGKDLTQLLGAIAAAGPAPAAAAPAAAAPAAAAGGAAPAAAKKEEKKEEEEEEDADMGFGLFD